MIDSTELKCRTSTTAIVRTPLENEMSFSIHAIAAIAWLLLTSANGPAFAAEPAAVVIEEVAAEPKKDAKTEKAKGNAKEAAGKVAGPLDLKAVAAPLVDALFGGGVVADVAADADAQNEAVAQQFVQQFHSILSSELAFVRQICPELAVEQRRKIVEVAQTSLKLAAKQMASQQNSKLRCKILARRFATGLPGD
jgi:hypothetical protein